MVFARLLYIATIIVAMHLPSIQLWFAAGCSLIPKTNCMYNYCELIVSCYWQSFDAGNYEMSGEGGWEGREWGDMQTLWQLFRNSVWPILLDRAYDIDPKLDSSYYQHI